MAGAMRKMGVYLGLVEDDGARRRATTSTSYDERAAHAARRGRARRGRRAARASSRARDDGRCGAARRAARPRARRRATAITTLHPRTYNEARTIGEHFREGTPVIMNLTEMDDTDAKRLVDFAAGLIFGLHGSIERVTNKVFLLSPGQRRGHRRGQGPHRRGRLLQPVLAARPRRGTSSRPSPSMSSGVFLALLFVRFIIDWVMVFARDWRPTGVVAAVLELAYSATDPPLKALRRLIPPLRLGSFSLDLAFIVLFIVVATRSSRSVAVPPTPDDEVTSMPLTPEDVQNKRFSTVRFKEGYDKEEVDAFLDEVEAELRRLLGENSDLRRRAAAACAAAAGAAAAVAAPPARARREEPQEAALRTLLLAQRTADEAIARPSARPTRSSPRRRRRPSLDASRGAARSTRQAMADLQRQRDALEAQIEELRGVRAGVPHPAQGLPRGPAARARSRSAASQRSAGRRTAPRPWRGSRGRPAPPLPPRTCRPPAPRRRRAPPPPGRPRRRPRRPASRDSRRRPARVPAAAASPFSAAPPPPGRGRRRRQRRAGRSAARARRGPDDRHVRQVDRSS